MPGKDRIVIEKKTRSLVRPSRPRAQSLLQDRRLTSDYFLPYHPTAKSHLLIHALAPLSFSEKNTRKEDLDTDQLVPKSSVKKRESVMCQ